MVDQIFVAVASISCELVGVEVNLEINDGLAFFSMVFEGYLKNYRFIKFKRD